MAIKKSELYSHLWASCDELRGGMDSSQYKDYVLVMLFIKYASDKYAGKPFAPIKIPEGAGFAGDHIDNGLMALQNFQCGCVWNRAQVWGLFDSFYRRHLAGSVGSEKSDRSEPTGGPKEVLA